MPPSRQTASGLALVSSQGTVSGCTIADNSEYGISLVESRVKIYGNALAKNGTGLKVENDSGAAWGNSFSANGRCDLLNAGTDDFRADGQLVGVSPQPRFATRICDRHLDPLRGRVLFFPAMTDKTCRSCRDGAGGGSPHRRGNRLPIFDEHDSFC